ncbi:MAG: RES family NAD+ phosphorylase [Bacteroidota bacterium]
MKCCLSCFDDLELQGFIRSNSTIRGECDYCQSSDNPLIDPRELEELFSQLVEIYQSINLNDFEGTQLKLHDKIQNEWRVFSELLNSSERESLLNHILTDATEEVRYLLTEYVERKVLLNGQINEQHLERWNDFNNEIKYNNRFFVEKEIDLELLEDLFNFHTKIYRKGKIFYRARVSKREGHPPKEMGKPPASKATSGRANPTGIPYLYVSTDIDTVVNECRATHLDYVTIAEYKLQDKLKVVSLRQIDNISPFLIGAELDEYLKNQKYLKTLENELSKPLRRHDDKLDYLPTQYLCEYAKSLNNDAIEYGSSLNNDGINLAIFNDEKLKINSTVVHEVIDLDLKTSPIN